MSEFPWTTRVGKPRGPLIALQWSRSFKAHHPGAEELAEEWYDLNAEKCQLFENVSEVNKYTTSCPECGHFDRCEKLGRQGRDLEETFWPEGFKQVIRGDVRQLIGAQLNNGKRFRRVYQQWYSEKFTDLGQFVGRIADMIVIGAENGADDAFDDIITAFLTESPLPDVGKYACYFWPQALPLRAKKRLEQVIVDECSQDEVYSHAYKVGYEGSYRNFGEFIHKVAQAVVIGAMNGADDMLERIYRSFVTHCPLPPARRHPRRLKS